jgi:hypothetical protein
MEVPKTPELSTGFKLPKGVHAYSRAFILPADLPEKDWATLGQDLSHLNERIQFWIGDYDWWRHGDRRYGERKSEATLKGLFQRWQFGTVMTYGWVEASVRTSIRMEVLSWSHHHLVAGMEEPEQVKWLQRAAKENWGTQCLYDRIRESREAKKTDAERAQDWYHWVLAKAEQRHLASRRKSDDTI